MKLTIVKNMEGYLRLRCGKYSFDEETGYKISKQLEKNPYIQSVTTNYVNGSILIRHSFQDFEDLLNHIKKIDLNNLPEITDKEEFKKVKINKNFENKVTALLVRRWTFKFLLPKPIGMILTLFRAAKRIMIAAKCLFRFKMKVEVLDASAILASLYQNNFATANNIMFFLDFSDILESYVSSNAKLSLSSSISSNIDKVWLVRDGQSDINIPLKNVKIGDLIRVQTGNMIPVDGCVHSGIAMVDESSMTGEMMPAKKEKEKTVFAGSVISEGSLVVEAKALPDDSKISKIVDTIINESDLKANLQSKAESFADSIVPFSFLGAIGVYFLTKSTFKALCVLMVDYSCAVKISTPLSIISAIKQSADNKILIKGGVFLEKLQEAGTIIFDKTGTLTQSKPTVAEVVTLSGISKDELLRVAACIEEHFPHSVAKAIVNQAQLDGLVHEEMHSEVKYIVAHGIATKLNGEKAVIGSRHFVFEDEKTEITENQKEQLAKYKDGYSKIYIGIGGKLAGFIAIYDPPRSEAPQVIKDIKNNFTKDIWMATGDSRKTAETIGKMLNIDKDKILYEALPEDKINLVKKLKSENRTVVMVGDGINDSPALAAADISISFKEASDLAKEVSNIVISNSDLNSILFLKKISDRMIQRINNNFKFILFSNTSFLLLGITGIFSSGLCALLHNASTAYVSLKSLKKYI